MNTIDFLKHVLPQAPAYYVQRLWYVDEKTTDDTKSRSFKATSLEALAKIIASESRQGYDVYISMAGFTADAKGHYAKFALSHKSHYQDIDCGPGKAYATQREALIAVHAFVQTVRLPMPLVVASGRGLHVYWPYTEDIASAATWLKMAWLFRAVCEHAGLMIDRPCGIDPVRLLRPPGTSHFKDRAAPKRVLTLPQQDNYQPVPVEDVAKALLTYVQAHAIQWSVPVEKPEVDADSDLSANMPGLDPYSATQIGQAGCIAVRWFMAKGGDALPPSKLQMSQGDWMSMGRLAKFSTEGEEWFHQYGAKYNGYSRAESQKVLNRIKKRGVTCDSLVQDPVAKKEICGRCTHYGKINTPLHLGIAKVIPLRPVPVEQAASADPLFQSNTQLVIPDPLPGYANRPTGVYKERMTEAGKSTFVLVVNNWLVDVAKLITEAGSHHYALKWLSPRGREQIMPISGEELGGNTTALLKKLGAADIVFSSSSKEVAVVGYIREWVRSIESANALPATEQLGWQRGMQAPTFVLGTDCYTSGTRSHARLVDALIEEAKMYRTMGTLDGQINALRTFFPNTPDFLHAHFLILLSMAPVFLFFDDLSSPIIAAHSESGHGKSLACRGALGVWGDPLMLEMKGGKGASWTSINNRLGAAATIPVVLDEMTGSNPKEIFDIIHLVQGNKKLDRANPNGTNRFPKSWQTVAIVSTNEALRGVLELADSVKDGMHMRLIEFKYSNPTIKSMGSNGASIKPLLENFGHVGRQLLLNFTNDIVGMELLYRASLTRLRQLPGESTRNDGGERIWQKCLSAVMALAIVTKQWGLLDIDIRAMHRFCGELLQQMRAELQEVSPDPLTRLNRIINLLSSKAVFVETAKPLVHGTTVQLVDADQRIPFEVVMRQERDTGFTYINCTEFSKVAGSFTRDVIDFAIANDLCEKRRQIRLRAYLGVPDGRVDCYRFNQRKIDALSHAAQGSAVVDDYEGIYDPPAKTGAHLHTVK